MIEHADSKELTLGSPGMQGSQVVHAPWERGDEGNFQFNMKMSILTI